MVTEKITLTNPERFSGTHTISKTKLESAAEKASAKIEESQASTEAQKAEARSKIEDKIAALKTKIADWQASDSANSSETLQAIAKAKESIERLVQQLKALQ